MEKEELREVELGRVEITDLDIYPVYVCVAVCASSLRIMRDVMPYERGKVVLLDDDGDENYNAYTFESVRNRDGKMGVVVRVVKSELPFSTYAHESVHATDYIFKLSGMSRGAVSNNEAYAYLCGYISELMKRAVDAYKDDLNSKKDIEEE